MKGVTREKERERNQGVDEPEDGCGIERLRVENILPDLFALELPDPFDSTVHQQASPLAADSLLDVARAVLPLDDERRFDRERFQEVELDERRNCRVDCGLIRRPGVQEQVEEAFRANGRERIRV